MSDKAKDLPKCVHRNAESTNRIVRLLITLDHVDNQQPGVLIIRNKHRRHLGEQQRAVPQDMDIARQARVLL